MDGPTKQHKLTCPSTFEHIDAFAALVEQAAREIALSEEEEVDLMIAVMEAVNNAILHGNKEDATKNVHMKIEANPSSMVIWVEDEGGGFVVDEIPDPLAPSNVLNTSGRGILMMQAFMDRVEIQPAQHGTVVKMTKEFSTKSSV